MHSASVRTLNAAEAMWKYKRIQMPTYSHFNRVQCEHVNDRIILISKQRKMLFISPWLFISAHKYSVAADNVHVFLLDNFNERTFKSFAKFILFSFFFI